MLGNHSLEVQLVKKSRERKDVNNHPEPKKEIDWDVVGQKAAIVQETAETVVKVVVGGYAFKKMIDTVCEIAVIAAKAKL